MLIDANQSALLIVDLQPKLLPAIHDHQAILGQATRLATIAGLLGVPVIGTEQTPDKLGPNHPDVRGLCGQVLAKSHFDACAEGLLPALPGAVRQLVVAGGETSGAVVQALGVARMAIGPQIDPGVPWTAVDSPLCPDAPLHLALKSGNFGSTDFFHKALRQLAQARP